MTLTKLPSSDYDRIVFGTNHSNKIKTAINKRSRQQSPFVRKTLTGAISKLKMVIPWNGFIFVLFLNNG